MKKFLGLLLLGLLLATVNLVAQGSAQSRAEKLKQALGMNTTEFASFSAGLKIYGQRLKDIYTDRSMDKMMRKAILDSVLGERSTYVKARLTLEQQDTLKEFGKSNTRQSPNLKQKQMLEERLKKKGAKKLS